MASSQSDPEAAGVASSTKQGQGEGVPGNAVSKLYEFKEQLLLLSTLVATVTYVAGLNLPGGSWEQDDPGGYMAGDPILRDTHYQRYLAFYYCNATALAASLVVSLILIIQEKKVRVWTVVLRVVMVLDLLSLMGAYAAGSCRDAFTTIYAGVAFFLVVLVVISVFFAFFYYLCLNGAIKVHSGSNSSPNSNHKHISNSNLNPDSNSDSISNSNSNPVSNPKPISFAGAGRRIQKQSSVVKLLTDANKQEKEQIDVLMLLATFAVAITYVAGLSPPGGFWNSTQHGHHLSDPVLQARGRYRAFFVCNTTSFALSLLIIVLLLEKKMLKNKKLVNILVRPVALYGLISIALLCLMGAYAAGSCRKADNTAVVLALAGAVPFCVCLQLALAYWKGLATKCACVLEWFKERFNTPKGTSVRKNNDQHIQNTRYLVMLLATLVVTITYQAGLDPPGGLWLDSRDGHTIGHPVLQTTHPTRYQVFFYSNSAAFVTSLVVIMMLQSKYLLTRHTLEAALVLDLFGLVTSYGAGSTRDVSASFYIIALAGIVLVYVIVHITIIDHAPEPHDGAAVLKDLDDKRKVLLLVAILAATLTYQAGLTPPGGFWIADDQGHGRRAGFPVLLDNYPRRYHAFFYSNAASFMASVTLILLLVNPKLYRPGIRCYALYLCMLVGMLGLMGAYAAGSSRHLKTSIYVLALVAAVSVFIALPVFLCWCYHKCVNAKAGQGCLFWCFGKCVKAKPSQVNNNNGDDNTNAADTTIITTNNNAADAATTATTNNNNAAAAATTTNNAAAATTTANNNNAAAAATTTNNNAAAAATTTNNNNAAAATTTNNNAAASTTTNNNNNDAAATTNNNNAAAATITTNNVAAAITTNNDAGATTTTNDNNSNEEKDRLEYLMLLGILGASMTYQTGLRPPGGLWQDNIGGYSAGNPILHDINKHRYNAFFYSNSTSFMASIVVVFMLLPLTIKKYRDRNLPLWPMHTAILLDMISLLVAYAAGSTREWETSRNVMFLIIPVLVYIAVYVTASVFYHREDSAKPPTSTPAHGAATPHQDAK